MTEVKPPADMPLPWIASPCLKWQLVTPVAANGKHVPIFDRHTDPELLRFIVEAVNFWHEHHKPFDLDGIIAKRKEGRENYRGVKGRECAGGCGTAIKAEFVMCSLCAKKAANSQMREYGV